MVSTVVEAPMKVLVTGASGFIGSRLCRALRNAGHEVVAVMRPRMGNCAYPQGRVVYAQLPYGIPLPAFEGVEVIIHNAGTTTGQKFPEAYAVNVEATRVLVERARELPHFSRFIYISSQSAHEGAVSTYGRTKRMGEEVVRASGVPNIIIRPGLVFGAGSDGLFARMRRTVEKLPVIPLLGGGKAPVQPIEVEDLCAAIVRCLLLPSSESFEFNLGLPEPITLAEFLATVGRALRGKPKPSITIPLAPLEWAVSLAETLHFPLPISKDNLEGMKTVRPMDTAPSLRALGLELKPLDEALVHAARDTRETALTESPCRVVLIGAGKIGIVHALNLSQRPGMILAGIMDTNPKAPRLYTQMGFRVPVFSDFTAMMEQLQPHAAIVATPAYTHLRVARQCLEAGLNILIEKPLVISPEQIPAYQKLVEEHADKVIHVGYMASQFPHLDIVALWLREKQVGRIVGLWGSSLQSHIIAPKPVRWEMRKSLAGGGVLTNFACHLLSIIFRLFGTPLDSTALLWSIFSTEVEDAADLYLNFGDFPCRIVTSWSAKGFARPETCLIIEGTDGIITLTNTGTELMKLNGESICYTQRDFDVGFNSAPDYTGAAFACEHINFLRELQRKSAREKTSVSPVNPSQQPVTVSEALRLERFIHELYQKFPCQTGRPASTASGLDVASRFNAELQQILEELL